MCSRKKSLFTAALASLGLCAIADRAGAVPLDLTHRHILVSSVQKGRSLCRVVVPPPIYCVRRGHHRYLDCCHRGGAPSSADAGAFRSDSAAFSGASGTVSLPASLAASAGGGAGGGPNPGSASSLGGGPSEADDPPSASNSQIGPPVYGVPGPIVGTGVLSLVLLALCAWWLRLGIGAGCRRTGDEVGPRALRAPEARLKSRS